MKKLGHLAKSYRVDNGKHFRLRDFDPGDTGTIKSKQDAAVDLELGIYQLRDLQDKLYAQHQLAVLLIFQAMDAAGKDGTIKHVMSGVNPAGCEVYSFKAPSGPSRTTTTYGARLSACRNAVASGSSTAPTMKRY